LKRAIKLERQEFKWFGVFQDGGNWFAFVNMVMNTCFHKERREFFRLYEIANFLSTLLYITLFINTYIDPVCPDHLTLRYCSCSTYLLHRRAELKAAPGST